MPAGDFTGLERDASQNGSVRVLVKLRTPPTQPAQVAAAQTALAHDVAPTDATIKRRFDSLGLVAMQATPETLRKLETSKLVASVGRDRILLPTLAHSVPTVQADQAAAAGYNGSGETIAVLDSGVDTAHPFLSGRVVSEACFASGDDMGAPSGDCPNGQETQTGTG
ncbi:MAG TPA: hypothetical protein VHP57_06330, partial [Acidimicrobiia bacterium]|nr:hypothetical protein [Acidimicrobiia bacterium]